MSNENGRPQTTTYTDAIAERRAVSWCGICGTLCILCETLLRYQGLPPDASLVGLAGVAVGALAAGVPGWTGNGRRSHPR